MLEFEDVALEQILELVILKAVPVEEAGEGLLTVALHRLHAVIHFGRRIKMERTKLMSKNFILAAAATPRANESSSKLELFLHFYVGWHHSANSQLFYSRAHFVTLLKRECGILPLFFRKKSKCFPERERENSHCRSV